MRKPRSQNMKSEQKKKKPPKVSERVKQAIRDRIDKGERNSSKLAKEFGVRTQQAAGIMARHLHPDSWA
jgi:hypothetical protein